MDHLFQEGFPAGFHADFERSIFLTQRHLQLQSPTGWCSFVILDQSHQRIVAEVHYHIEGDQAKSPIQSPFGSFVFSRAVSAELLKEFVSFTEQRLIAKGVKMLLLKNSPEAYDPNGMAKLRKVLLGADYKIELEELSAVISVGKQSFASVLHRSHKKKLRKCHEKNLAFQFLSLDHLEEVYELLKIIREEKKYSLSMSLQAMRKVTAEFPDHFHLSVVKDDQKIVAANISIRVNSNVLYNFYHDHLKEYDAISPVVILNEGLYEYCQQQGIELLDVGTSTIDGKINTPLLDFKLRLGAQPSRKLTFVKNLF